MGWDLSSIENRLERVDLQQRKRALALFRAADVAFNGVTGAQAEVADLRGRDGDDGERTALLDIARLLAPLRRADRPRACLLIGEAGSDRRAVKAARLIRFGRSTRQSAMGYSSRQPLPLSERIQALPVGRDGFRFGSDSRFLTGAELLSLFNE